MAFKSREILSIYLVYFCLQYSLKFHVAAFHEYLKLPGKSPDMEALLNKAASFFLLLNWDTVPQVHVPGQWHPRKKVKASTAYQREGRIKTTHSKGFCVGITDDKRFCVSGLPGHRRARQENTSGKAALLRLIELFYQTEHKF